MGLLVLVVGEFMMVVGTALGGALGEGLVAAGGIVVGGTNGLGVDTGAPVP